MEKTSIRALQYIGCLDMNDTLITDDSLQCLVHADTAAILNATVDIVKNPGVMMPTYVKNTIGPVVDGEIIPGVPEVLLQNSSSAVTKVFNSKDLLMGINSAEGGLFLDVLRKLQKDYNFNFTRGIPTSVLCQVVAKSLTDQYYNSNKKVEDALCGAYTTLAGPGEQARAILNLLGDWLFSVPMKIILDIHSKSSRNTYQYLFSKESPDKFNYLPPWFKGVNHGSEIVSVFGPESFHIKDATPAALNLSQLMMRYWTNFARTG